MAGYACGLVFPFVSPLAALYLFDDGGFVRLALLVLSREVHVLVSGGCCCVKKIVKLSTVKRSVSEILYERKEAKFNFTPAPVIEAEKRNW